MPLETETPRKQSRLARFFATPVVGLTGILASVIGVVLAVYFYQESVVRPDLTYYVNPIRASVIKGGVTSSLAVFNNDTKLESDVSAVQIAIWNRGRQSIRRGQVLKPIALQVSNAMPILEATVRRSSRDIVKLELDRSRLTEGVVLVSWDILEESDGGIIQLIYAGGADAKIAVEGIVEGQRSLSEAQFSGRLESPAEQYQWRVGGKRIAGWILLGMSTFSVAIILLLHVFRLRAFSSFNVSDWVLFAQSVMYLLMAIYILFTSRDVGPPFGFE